MQLCKVSLPDTDLRQAVYAAAGRPEVRTAVAAIYRDLQQAIDLRKPVCVSSGRCCHFEEFGHRLMVTTVELSAFIYELELGNTPLYKVPEEGGGCRFQVGKQCSVHTIRPFGCRVFFCDSTSDDWQHAQYERLHAQLKAVHETFGVPYFYCEWRAALSALLD